MFLLLGAFYHVKSPALREDVVPGTSSLKFQNANVIQKMTAKKP